MSIRRRPAYLDWVFEYKIGENEGADFLISDVDWHTLSHKDLVELFDHNIQRIIDLARGKDDN